MYVRVFVIHNVYHVRLALDFFTFNSASILLQFIIFTHQTEEFVYLSSGTAAAAAVVVVGMKQPQ